jgi:hypothetical protein
MGEDYWFPGGPMNLYWMACPLAVAIACSISAMRTNREWRGQLLLGAYVAVMAILDNWYWSIFPRGEGWFTANRMSAVALLAAVIAGSWWVRRHREHLEWWQAARERAAFENDHGIAALGLSEEELAADALAFRDAIDGLKARDEL